MRRNASFALAVCLLAVTGAQPAAASAPGDLNDDGVWDARDALLLEQYLSSEVTLSAAQLAAADVAPLGLTTTTAGDGVVDAGDLVVLLRFLANDDLDGDGLSAAFEVAHGYSPLVTDEDGNGVLDGLDDDDQDGLSNADEERMGFDPRNHDSDGDGILDSLELASVPSQAVATNASTSTEFLFDQTETETTPLQTEAETAELDPDVLAVLRGTVRTRAGELLAGVRVSILGRPEFGATTTRIDGMFDLAVNGGATLTVLYDHPDFLAVQRKATVPWQDYYTLPDVVLIPLDEAYADVDLSQPPGIQVARGSVSVDTAGARQATLLFRQGTVVTAVLPDDTQQTLAAIRVRATEYTVGDTGTEAMPGELPPQSAYTYAVEFTADEARTLGAKQVRFSLPGAPEPIASYPVSSYLENFLGLPVGTTMPNGYYDHEKGAWLPEKSGVVLKIVGVTGGSADLDTTGDGLADDTTGLGIPTEERTKLAELYTVGDELWWVPLSHFSDFNIGPVFETPDIKPGEPVADGETPPGQTEICSASTIVCESQVLIETVPVVGTPFALSYASDRTPGYTANYTMRFPLRDVPVLPSNILGVTLEVSVAGKKHAYRYAPTEVNANGKQVVEWDGTDAYGRVLQGRQPVKAELTYEYGFQYQDVPIFGQSGDGTAIPGAQPRTRTTIRQPWFGFVGGWDARGSGLGGWSLSPHHSYDPYSRVLYTGDGRQRRAEQLPDVIRRVVGGGSNSNVPAQGGIPATTFQFASGGFPRSVAAGADGSLFVAMSVPGWPSRIYKVDPSGLMTRFGCFGSSSADGIAALSAVCHNINDLVVAPDGTLLLSESVQRRVRKITPDGKIWTVAGVGQDEHVYNGDGIPATEAHLGNPTGLGLGPDGSLYIADSSHRRIRRVDPRGTIWTIAGGGGTPPATGVPAATASFSYGPDSVALDASGNVYFSSISDHKIWRVSPDGVLHHFAGNGNDGLTTGEQTPPGDGQPAVDATIPNARGLAVGRDGSVYFATQVANGGYHSVRRVAPSGIISTVTGAGPFGSSGDGGPAAAALLSNPLDVEVAPDGSLYVSSQHVHVGAPRVRKIEPAFPGAAAGTISITSEDGQERYEFDGSGKHLATYETTGNTVLYSFGCDAEDRLTSITDGDGNVTTIEHDGQGNPIAIVAPFGQRTTLASDAEGWLSSVTDPAGGEYGLVSQPDGLLTSYTDPNGASASYEYGAYGYLAKDTDRAGGWLELARTDASGVSEVTITSRLGRTRSHRTERLLPDGAERLDEAELRTTTDAAGLETTQLRDVDEVRTVTSPQGVVSVVTSRPDFRFGMASPFPGSLTIETPGGRALTRTMTRTGAMAGSSAPVPGVLTDQADTITQNGRTSTVVWDHDAAVSWNGGSLGLRRITSAASRIFEEALDARGRPVGSRLGTLHPVRVTYDTHGRIETTTHGPGGAGDRTTTFAYDPATGRLDSITDPASRTTSFDAYDDAGRALQMTLPGGRVVAFDYDANGNLTSLSPPGRPAHVFRYTPVDLESEYEPPAVTGIPDTRTLYEYDLDRSLTLVTRPDGKTVDLDYEPATGRLETVTIAAGAYAYGYHTTTDPQTGEAAGQLATVTAPGGQSLAYSWDGTLPTGTTWSGPVAGSVARSFDDDFRVETESVNGSHTVTLPVRSRLARGRRGSSHRPGPRPGPQRRRRLRRRPSHRHDARQRRHHRDAERLRRAREPRRDREQQPALQPRRQCPGPPRPHRDQDRDDRHRPRHGERLHLRRRRKARHRHGERDAHRRLRLRRERQPHPRARGPRSARRSPSTTTRTGCSATTAPATPTAPPATSRPAPMPPARRPTATTRSATCAASSSRTASRSSTGSTGRTEGSPRRSARPRARPPRRRSRCRGSCTGTNCGSWRSWTRATMSSRASSTRRGRTCRTSW